jgi:DNA-binding transcriptional regulator YdaS (Cro superfamily)
MVAMNKTEAIQLLGGSAAAAARAIGISVSAISQWPADLTPAIRDRVQAAIARRHLSPEMLGMRSQEPDARKANLGAAARKHGA